MSCASRKELEKANRDLSDALKTERQFAILQAIAVCKEVVKSYENDRLCNDVEYGAQLCVDKLEEMLK